MDERLRDIVENLDSMKIELDETFKFRCKMCGNCCINREDILLSPKDIYNMSKELGLTADSLIVCAMFPIGRCLIADDPKEGLKNISQDLEMENTEKFFAMMNATFSQGGDRSLFFLFYKLNHNIKIIIMTKKFNCKNNNKTIQYKQSMCDAK